MEIIYPSLVEESLALQKPKKNYKLAEKADRYRLMVEKKIIAENGEPTEYAIEQGWVKEFYETENLSLEQFLTIYPVFKRYDLELLQKIDGFWEIPLNFKEMLLQEIAENTFDYDEMVQLSEYLSDR